MKFLVINEAPFEQIEEIIRLNANVNAVNKIGLTPLMMACRVGDTKMVHLLMKNGASALQRGNKAGLGRTALFEIFLSLFDFYIKIFQGIGARFTKVKKLQK
jgi:ankyrin repeat protein